MSTFSNIFSSCFALDVRIKSLYIRSKVSDAGLAHLAQLPASLQHLVLYLWDTEVPDALAFLSLTAKKKLVFVYGGRSGRADTNKESSRMFLRPLFRTSTPEFRKRHAPQADRQVSDTGLAHLAQLPAALQHLALNLRSTKVKDGLFLHSKGINFFTMK